MLRQPPQRFASLGFALSVLAIAWLLDPKAGQAETLDALFAEGNAAFFQGDYDEAIARYQTLIESGVRDADVYFNLATAYAQAGAFSRAVLNFERARRLAPEDEATAEDLAAARDALARRDAERTGEAVVRTRPPIREALVSGFSEDTLALWLLIANVLCFGALLTRHYLTQESPRLAATLVASLTGLVGVLAAAGFAIKVGAGQAGDPIVVLSTEALREGPDPKAQSRGEVAEGSLARALGTEGKWVRVRVVDGEAGWLPEPAVGRVNPD